jgi:tripartite-type tricarboxylate transporter receptor subunit TctC
MPTRTRAWWPLLASGLWCGVPALAQDYPQRPVRVVVPLPPGGAMDTIVRGVSQRLGQALNQTFVIDNRPGAGGRIALEIGMTAAPDGYTLISVSAASILYPLLYKTKTDAVRDFEPVSQISAQGYCVVVHPSMPARTPPELVKVLKAHPGKYQFGSSGVAGAIHLTGELFMSATGTKMLHVPYKGTAMAYTDLISGNLQVGFPTIVSALQHMKAGRIRGIGVTTPNRSPAAPELPTLAETGITGVEVVAWYGIVAPKGTPRAVVDRLNGAIVEALQQPEMVKRLRADGSDAVSSTPEQFRTLLATEKDKWSRVLKQAGIKPE